MVTELHSGAQVRPLVLSVNSAWNIVNFRAGLVRALIGSGYRIVALAPDDGHAQGVRDLGCEFIDLPMQSHGVNPWRDGALFFRYLRILRGLRPSAFLGFTIKPNVYGSLAAHALDVPVINNIAGLGAAFVRRDWLRFVASSLYKVSLRSSTRVFFQNSDDQRLFLEEGLVREDRAQLLPGSGVDLAWFSLRPFQHGRERPVFLFVGRLLQHKGVTEFVDALRILRAQGVPCEARLLGSLDAANPSSIGAEKVRRWESEGLVRYLGFRHDVREAVGEADVVVLPSYVEGTPRSLLEAAAMGRPLVATDVPGSRDVIRDGENGFLVPIRDSVALAAVLRRMSEIGAERREAMGVASRRLVERNYDEQEVIARYLALLGDLQEGQRTLLTSNE